MPDRLNKASFTSTVSSSALDKLLRQKPHTYILLKWSGYGGIVSALCKFVTVGLTTGISRVM